MPWADLWLPLRGEDAKAQLQFRWLLAPCRAVVYFDTASKKIVVRNVIVALAKGGYLVTGPTEGIYAMLGPLTKIKAWLYQRPA
jgi:chemotaxis methyl-accepting protein methylase